MLEHLNNFKYPEVLCQYYVQFISAILVISKAMRAYSKFDIEPEPDDPVYKYWTLW